jgi:hypothetical protein
MSLPYTIDDVLGPPSLPGLMPPAFTPASSSAPEAPQKAPTPVDIALLEPVPSAQNAHQEAVGPSTIAAGELLESLTVKRFINSGQTDYNTGTGWWIGDDGGTPKLSIGDGNLNSLTWDGSTLSLVGSLTVGTAFTAAESISAGDAVAIGPYQSDGGITLDAKSVAQRTQTSGSVTVSFTVGNNSNRILIVSVISGSSINTPTFNGDTMTAVVENLGVASGFFSLWYLLAPDVATGDVVIGGFDGSSGVETAAVAIYSYYNVAQSAPASLSDTDADGETSIAVTPAANGALIFSVIGIEGATGPSTTNMQGNTGSAAGSGNNIATGDSYKLANTSVVTVTGTVTGTPDAAHYTLALSPATAPTYRAHQADASNGADYGWNTNWKANAFAGFAYAAATLGNSCIVIVSGTAPGLSNLQPTAQYYLSDTAGAVSTTAGTNTRKVGIAVSSTSLTITNLW